MKKLLLSLSVFISLLLNAQAPQGFNYQASIRDASNVIVANQNVGLRVTLIKDSISGINVYQETFSDSTSATGVVNIVIGTGTVVSGSFSSIDWGNGPYFIEIAVDVNGGTTYQVMGTQQLMSVPYALYAENVSTSLGGSGFAHYIGEPFGGGVIFHLWKDSAGMENGLIVDLNDLSISQVWSNVDSTQIGSSAQSRWDGLSNSNAIVGQAGHTSSAASLCLNSTNGGQSDWYLPSVDELGLLWHNCFNVNKTLSTIGSATILIVEDYYWSSTEYTSNLACYFYFNYGFENLPEDKYFTYRIRAVRAF